MGRLEICFDLLSQLKFIKPGMIVHTCHDLISKQHIHQSDLEL